MTQADIKFKYSNAAKLAYIRQHVDPSTKVKNSCIVTLNKDMKVFKQTIHARSGQQTVLVNMIIPAGATIHIGRGNVGCMKCRADKAKVISQFGYDRWRDNYTLNNSRPFEVLRSFPKMGLGSTNFVYITSKDIVPDKFAYVLQECAGGIHFFVTLQEAYWYN